MADRVPLIVDSVNLNIKELPVNDNLDLANSNIINVGSITMNVNASVDVFGGTLSNVSSTTLAENGTVDLSFGSITNIGNITTSPNTTVILNSSAVFVNAVGNTSTYANLDLSSHNYFTATAADNTIFTFNNTQTGNVGVSFVLELANGGDYTITWPSTVRWPSNTAPTLSTSGNTDMFVFFSDNDGEIWRAAYQTGYITT